MPAAPNWLRGRVLEEAAEVVLVFRLRRVPPLRRCESEDHWPEIHGAVRRLNLEAPDTLELLTKARDRWVALDPPTPSLVHLPAYVPAATEPIDSAVNNFGTP